MRDSIYVVVNVLIVNVVVFLFFKLNIFIKFGIKISKIIIQNYVFCYFYVKIFTTQHVNLRFDIESKTAHIMSIIKFNILRKSLVMNFFL